MGSNHESDDCGPKFETHKPFLGADARRRRLQSWVGDVRYGSLADIAGALPNVRFTPKSGHH
jgi:hypothetical protein